MILTLIQAGIFLSYLTFILIKLGILPSISDSWYELQGLQKSLFTWFCFSLGVTMFFQTNGTAPALFFLSGSGLVLVGVATRFMDKESKEPLMHFTGAATCIIGALVGIGVERGFWLPLIYFILVSSTLSIFKIKNKIIWVEIIAFIFIILGFLTTSL